MKTTLLYGWLLLWSCNDCAHSNYVYIKPMRIGGKVHYRYLDPDNHATHMLVIAEQGKHIRHEVPFALYEYSTIGDSIFKDSASLTYWLVKPDTAISFYPACNGKELKEDW